MSHIETILCQAEHLGIKIEATGENRISLSPAVKCPPDFVEVCRAVKPQLLEWFRLTCLANAVLRGEFDGADHRMQKQVFADLCKLDPERGWPALERLMQ